MAEIQKEIECDSEFWEGVLKYLISFTFVPESIKSYFINDEDWTFRQVECHIYDIEFLNG